MANQNSAVVCPVPSSTQPSAPGDENFKCGEVPKLAQGEILVKQTYWDYDDFMNPNLPNPPKKCYYKVMTKEEFYKRQEICKDLEQKRFNILQKLGRESSTGLITAEEAEAAFGKEISSSIETFIEDTPGGNDQCKRKICSNPPTLFSPLSMLSSSASDQQQRNNNSSSKLQNAGKNFPMPRPGPRAKSFTVKSQQKPLGINNSEKSPSDNNSYSFTPSNKTGGCPQSHSTDNCTQCTQPQLLGRNSNNSQSSAHGLPQYNLCSSPRNAPNSPQDSSAYSLHGKRPTFKQSSHLQHCPKFKQKLPSSPTTSSNCLKQSAESFSQQSDCFQHSGNNNHSQTPPGSQPSQTPNNPSQNTGYYTQNQQISNTYQPGSRSSNSSKDLNKTSRTMNSRFPETPENRNLQCQQQSAPDTIMPSFTNVSVQNQNTLRGLQSSNSKPQSSFPPFPPKQINSNQQCSQQSRLMQPSFHTLSYEGQHCSVQPNEQQSCQHSTSGQAQPSAQADQQPNATPLQYNSGGLDRNYFSGQQRPGQRSTPYQPGATGNRGRSSGPLTCRSHYTGNENECTNDSRMCNEQSPRSCCYSEYDCGDETEYPTGEDENCYGEVGMDNFSENQDICDEVTQQLCNAHQCRSGDEEDDDDEEEDEEEEDEEDDDDGCEECEQDHVCNKDLNCFNRAPAENQNDVKQEQCGDIKREDITCTTAKIANGVGDYADNKVQIIIQIPQLVSPPNINVQGSTHSTLSKLSSQSGQLPCQQSQQSQHSAIGVTQSQQMPLNRPISSQKSLNVQKVPLPCRVTQKTYTCPQVVTHTQQQQPLATNSQPQTPTKNISPSNSLQNAPSQSQYQKSLNRYSFTNQTPLQRSSFSFQTPFSCSNQQSPTPADCRCSQSSEIGGVQIDYQFYGESDTYSTASNDCSFRSGHHYNFSPQQTQQKPVPQSSCTHNYEYDHMNSECDCDSSVDYNSTRYTC